MRGLDRHLYGKATLIPAFAFIISLFLALVSCDPQEKCWKPHRSSSMHDY